MRITDGHKDLLRAFARRDGSDFEILSIPFRASDPVSIGAIMTFLESDSPKAVELVVEPKHDGVVFVRVETSAAVPQEVEVLLARTDVVARVVAGRFAGAGVVRGFEAQMPKDHREVEEFPCMLRGRDVHVERVDRRGQFRRDGSVLSFDVGEGVVQDPERGFWRGRLERQSSLEIVEGVNPVRVPETFDQTAVDIALGDSVVAKELVAFFLKLLGRGEMALREELSVGIVGDRLGEGDVLMFRGLALVGDHLDDVFAADDFVELQRVVKAGELDAVVLQDARDRREEMASRIVLHLHGTDEEIVVRMIDVESAGGAVGVLRQKHDGVFGHTEDGMEVDLRMTVHLLETFLASVDAGRVPVRGVVVGLLHPEVDRVFVEMADAEQLLDAIFGAGAVRREVRAADVKVMILEGNPRHDARRVDDEIELLPLFEKVVGGELVFHRLLVEPTDSDVKVQLFDEFFADVLFQVFTKLLDVRRDGDLFAGFQSFCDGVEEGPFPSDDSHESIRVTLEGVMDVGDVATAVS